MFAWMLHRRRKDPDQDPRERSLWGDLISLGMVFPLCIVLGYYGGGWLGAKLGFPEAGKLVGLAWGIAAAFWELYKVTKKLERADSKHDGDDAP